MNRILTNKAAKSLFKAPRRQKYTPPPPPPPILCCKTGKEHHTMNGRTSIFRRSFLLCLIVLMAACKKDDESMNAAPTIEAQILAVAENAGVEAAVGTVAATDAQNDELTFSITEVSRNDAFAINASTGAITVAGALDHETTAAYTLTVQVSDGSLTATAEVTINVTDVNEPPVIDAEQNSTFSITENAAAGTAVGTVVATDQDEGDDDLTFAITNGNASEAFQIDNTGAVTVKTPAALDFETTPTFMLTVQVSDDENLSDDAEITVNLTNVDEAPAIAAQTFSIAEDAANGTTVGTVTATDMEGDNLTFSIIVGNIGNAFAINENTGTITVAGTIDHETTPTYTLTVRVSDGMTSVENAVTINVTDVNEAPVVTAQNAAFDVTENATNGTAVGTVAATDEDGDNLTFSITNGNTGSAFAINENTGAVTVAGTVDYETTPTFTLTVSASDESLSGTADFIVNVTNVNDNAPVVTAQNAVFTVIENAGSGTAVGTVAAMDEDGDNLTFSITSGNIGTAFAINENTGAVTVAGTVDYETTPTYTLTVLASDGNLSGTADFIVNVTNVNDNPPVVTAQNAAFSVAESVAVGTVVGTAAATDADGDVPNFSITTGNTGNAFAINENTGAIAVAQKLDFETTSTYTLTVQVSDGSLSGTADYAMDVTNVARGARLSGRDLNTLRGAGNTNPLGLWSDGTTMWVVNSDFSDDDSKDKIFAYTLATGARDATKDIDSLNAAGNNVPTGLWSDGTTLWVVDNADDKVYAYTLTNGMRDAGKNIDLDDANSSPVGIWSNGTTLWVVNNDFSSDDSDDKIFAYTLATGARDADKDLNTLNGAGNNDPYGLWSDDTTIWISDSADDKLYAYKLADGTRDTGKDIDLLTGFNGNTAARCIWSDGITIWVGNASTRIVKIFGYFLDN